MRHSAPQGAPSGRGRTALLAVLFCTLALTPALADPIDLRIHWIEPAWVPAATGGSVEVSGLGFDDTLTASLDGTALPASSLQLLSPTRLLLTLPPAASARISDLELTRTLDTTNTQTAVKAGGIFYTGATTWYVRPDGSDANAGTSPSSPKLTIGAAITAAMGVDPSSPNPPAQIHVAEGTYVQNLRLPRGTVLLGGYSADFTQRDPDTFISVIDGGRNNLSAVRTTGATQNFCLLDGFTITNSRRTGAGGAVRSFLGSPTVTNNVLIGNVASRRGGAIYFRFADIALYGNNSSTIAKNLIVGNRARELGGGGVNLYAYYYTNQGHVGIAVTDNIIVGNRAVRQGGGVSVGTPAYYAQDRLNVSVSNNQLHFNQAENGGALATYGSLASQMFIRAHNNLMSSNTAADRGGAVYLGGAGGGELLITSSTLAGNAATEGGALFRAVPERTGSQFTALIDDILWSNTGGDVGDPEGQVIIHFTDSNDDFSLRGGGNFSLDPLFLPGPLGAFYLDPASPAVDAGSELSEARGLSERTTQTSQELDAGRLDLGVHYPVVLLTTGATPQLLHLVPAFGDFQGGDWVLVRGTAFDPGAQVTFDSADAVRTLFVAANRLLAEPPPRALEGAFTLVDVQVVNPGGLASPQLLPYRFVDAEPPEWDSTIGPISADSPRESTLTIIVRWNPAIDAVSGPVTYNVHRVQNLSASSQLRIPQATNRIASGLTGTSYVDTDFKNNEDGTSWVYRVHPLDLAYLPNEEMNLVRVFGTVLSGTNPPRPDPAVYLLGPRQTTSGDTLALELLVSNQGTAAASSITLELTLSQNLFYQAGSTCVLPAGARDCLDALAQPVPDDAADTPFPLDTPGFTISNLPHSTSTRLSFVVEANGAGSLSSWVGVVSTPEAEIRTDNNRSERFINVQPDPTVVTDVAVIKSGPLSALTGSEITYSIRVSNNGSEVAENVVLTDTLPAGVTYVASSTLQDGNPVPDDMLPGTAFPLDEAGLALGSLAGSEFTIVEFRAALNASSGTVANQANVISTTEDSNLDNNISQAITQVTIADLAVSAGAPVEALQGSTFELSVSLANAGDAAADSVLLNDVLPATLEYVPGTTLREDGNPVPDDTLPGTAFPLDEGGLGLDTLPAGASTTLTFSVLATAGSGTATHTASATTTTPESTTANNSASATTTLLFVDLVLGKSAPASATVSAEFDYTLDLSNAGSGAAAEVVLSDTLPAEVTYVAGSTLQDGNPVLDDTLPGTAFPLDEGGLALGGLGAGASTQITFRVTAPAVETALSNSASASTSSPEPDTANNTAQAGTQVTFADLALSASAPLEALQGSVFALSATLSNAGGVSADAVVLTDTLPATLTYVAGTTLQDGAPVPDDAVGTAFPLDEAGLGLGTLPAGASTTLTFSVLATAGSGTATHTASATTTTPESTTVNNSASATTTLLFVDLALSKSAPSSAAVSAEFDYTLDLSNAGSGAAADVVLSDALPAEVTYVAGSTLRDGVAVPDDAGGTAFPLDEGGLALGGLGPGASTRITFRVSAPAVETALSNSASASTSSPEPDTTNNGAAAATQVLTAQADLSLVKSALAGVVSGIDLVYTLDVSVLPGPGTSALGVTLLDTLPAGVTYLAGTTLRDGLLVADDSAGTAFPLDEGGLVLGDLAASSSTRIQFSARVDLASGTLVNQGTVSALSADPDLSNNSSQVTTVVVPSGSLQPVGESLRWTMDDILTWDPAQGAALYFVYRSALASDFTTGGAALQTPSGVAQTTYGDPEMPNPGNVLYYRVSAGDGSMETDELHMADLVVQKSAPEIVFDGTTMTYTVEVRNIGVREATSAVLTDALPLEGVYVAGSTLRDGFTVADDAAGTPFPLDEAGLEIGPRPGESLTTISFEAAFSGINLNVTNTASVSTATPEHTASNNSDAASSSLEERQADVVIVKSGPATVTPSSVFTYTLTITNAGPLAATLVTVTDALPPEVSYQRNSTTLNGTAVPDTSGANKFPLSTGLDIGTLDPAATATITFDVKAPNSSATVTNQASASATELDPDLSNNTASATTVVESATAQADLAISKLASPEPVQGGGSALQYTLSVTNDGDLAADTVLLTDTLPAEVTFVSATPVPSTINGNILEFALGTLEASDGAPGGTDEALVVIDVTVDILSGSITNQASVSTTTAEDNLTNNSAQATSTVQAPALANLVLTKQAPASVAVGSTFTYTLSVTNSGTAAADATTLLDTLPAGAVYVTGSTTRDAVAVPDDAVGTPFPLDEAGLDLGTLGIGTSTEVRFDVIAPVTATTLSNTASVSTTTSESDLTDNQAGADTIVETQADLSITKSGPATVTTTSVFTYTLSVTNAGPSTANSVMVLDTLPVEVAYVAASTLLDGVAVADDGVGTPFPLDEAGLDIGALLATASSTVTFEVTAPGVAATLINQASVTATESDPDATNNSSSSTTTVEAPVEADLSITKSGPATVTTGSVFTYTLSVTNAGPSTANSVVVLDTLPVEVAYVTGSTALDGVAVADDATGTPFPLDEAGLDIGALLATASSTVTFEVTAPGVAATLINQASVTATESDPDATNNSSSSTTTVEAPVEADVSITKSGPATVTTTSVFTYTLSVSNAGPSTANSVAVLDTLPVEVAYVAGSTLLDGVAVADDATGTPFPLDEAGLDIGALVAAASSTVTFDVTAPGVAATLINQASVTATESDPNGTNNSASASTTVDVGAEADLSIMKTGPLSVVQRTIFTYTLTVTNTGPSTATTVTVIDTLPPEVTYQAGTTTLDGAPVPDNPGGIKFPLPDPGLDIGSLAAGASAVITFDVKAPSAGPTLLNQASVSAAETDPNTTNNAASASTTVEAAGAADLALVKSASPDPVLGGGSTLLYTLTLINNGTLAADGVLLTDTLPVEVTFVSATPAPTTINGNILEFALGTLEASDGAPGGTDEALVVIDVTVDLLSGSIINQASVSTTTTENNLTDNSAQTTTTVQEPPSANLVLTKQAPVSVAAGDTITYILTVSNSGTAAADATMLTDTLPAGAAYVAGSTTRDAVAVPDDAVGTPFPLDEGGLDLGTLAIAATTDVRFDVTVPTSAGTLSNTASVSTVTSESDLTDNQAGADTSVVAQADVSITKSGPATVTTSSVFTYTLSVTNAGPSTANSVAVLDTLPVQVAYVAGSTTLDGVAVADDATGTPFPLDGGGLDLGTLSATATLEVSFDVTAPVTATTLSNTASVSTTTSESDLTDNQAGADTIVETQADLSISKSGPATVFTDSTFTYTLSVTNAGPSTANSVVVLDTLPVELSYVAGSTTLDGVAVADDATGTPFPLDEAGLDSGALLVEASTTVIFDVVAPSTATTVLNQASVAAAETDPNGADNSASLSTTVEVLPVADLSISKSGPATALKREIVTYTLVVTNNGPETVPSVVVTDTLPSGATYQANTTTLDGAPAPDNPGGTKFPLANPGLDIGSLAPGATATITFDVKMPNLAATVVNQADVSGTTSDPDLSNNSASASTDVL